MHRPVMVRGSRFSFAEFFSFAMGESIRYRCDSLRDANGVSSSVGRLGA